MLTNKLIVKTMIYPLLLCLVLFFILHPLHIFAATPPAITSVIAPIDKNASHDVATVRPGTLLEYPLTSDMFDWSSPPGAPGTPVTLSQLRQGRVTIKYHSSPSTVVDDVILSTMQFNGQTTACVKVQFAEEFVSVEPREFKLTIYLSVGNARQNDSEITLYGDFGNEEVTVDSGDDYADLSDGKVLITDDYIANLEIDMGDDIHLFTKVSSGRKYYATARNQMTNADDAMLTKYPAIQAVIHLTTVNLTPSGKCVLLKDIGDYHVYDAKGGYLGQTNGLVAYSQTYYLTDEKIDMGGAVAGSNDAAGDKPLSPFGGTPKEEAAKSDMADAANAAAQSDADTANVTVRDVESISSAELEAMYEAAALAKMKASYAADTTNAAGGVQGRIEINPALAVKLDRDILLRVYTTGTEVTRITSIFEKTYSNRLCAVHLSQTGSYGMKVGIVARIQLENVQTSNLHLYLFDSATNSFRSFPAPDMFLDGNGFLHFNTIYGGDIIISEGPLAR